MGATDFKISDETGTDFRTWLIEDEEGAGKQEDSLFGAQMAVPMADWATLAPEPRVGPLSFKGFPFQGPNPVSSSGPGVPGLYSEEVADAREVVIQKATQAGVSALMWRWAARRADQFADRVLYLFPTDRHVTEFGRERIDTSIEESPYLQSRCPAGVINNQHQKRIGDGWLYLRGTVASRAQKRAAGAQSVAAQAIVFDEYDDLEPGTVAQFERRLSGASQSGGTSRVRRVGVPTVDDYGVALAYAQSDRRRWHVTCGECKKEHVPEWTNVRWTTRRSGDQDVCRPGHDLFEDDKDVAEAWRVCPHCETEVDVADGRWLATNPGHPIIGFHVPRLIIPGADIESIVVNSRGRKLAEIEAFHQNDLGEPYTTADAGIGRDVLEAASSMGDEFVSSYSGPFIVTAGLDVASARDLNMRISAHDENGIRHPLWIGTVSSFDEAATKMDLYNIRLLAVDHLPERREARALAAAFAGRVVLARYDDDVKKPIDINEVDNLVAANRTDAIDAALEGIRSGRTRLPRSPPMDYIEHLGSMRRRLEWDARGRPTYRYVSVGTKGDDFVHAEVFDLMAKETIAYLGLVGFGEVEEVVSGGIEMTGEPLAEDYESRGWGS